MTESGRVHSALERAEEGVDRVRVRLVELAARLVGEDDGRLVRDRRPLPLPARQLVRARAEPVPEPDALEQRGRPLAGDVESTNVQGVITDYHGLWDLGFTSLK